jgi:hypothetical protein
LARQLKAGLGWLRSFADRRARRHILVLGDSHVRIFEHWLFLLRMPRTRFEIVHVPGGSVIGILNSKSISGARQRFDAALGAGRFDRVIVGLGEVDIGFALWGYVKYRRLTREEALDLAVGRYLSFLEVVAASHRLVVLGACLPTVDRYLDIDDPLHRQRSAVTADRRERTEVTRIFNDRIAAWCRERGIVHLDSAEAALGPDGLVRPDWIHRDRIDNHYVRGPFARWLVGAMRRL